MTDLRVGLASLRICKSIDEGIEKISRTLTECSKQNVDIVCFPEAYLPGLRGTVLKLPPVDQKAMEDALNKLQKQCAKNKIHAIVGMEWLSDIGLENRAFVISSSGEVQGYQTKNQITPGGESENYVADKKRSVFEINGIKYGIVICHEGWRYPETVRWATLRGARLIFQPQWTGSDIKGKTTPDRGESIYEKAMVCRAIENDVYFISVNVAMSAQNSSSSIIDPKGKVIDFIPRGEEKLLIADIDTTKATRLHAKRYNPKLYPKK